MLHKNQSIALWIISFGLVSIALFSVMFFSPESKFVGEWERVSPPINKNIVDNVSYSATCNILAPRNIYFFSDKKYGTTGDTALFAGGEYLAKKNVLRMQTVRGFEIVRYTQAENGQLTLTFNDVLTDCIATYERVGGGK